VGSKALFESFGDLGRERFRCCRLRPRCTGCIKNRQQHLMANTLQQSDVGLCEVVYKLELGKILPDFPMLKFRIDVGRDEPTPITF